MYVPFGVGGGGGLKESDFVCVCVSFLHVNILVITVCTYSMLKVQLYKLLFFVVIQSLFQIKIRFW